jgi:polysaccharide biosynthesis/export protein
LQWQFCILLIISPIIGIAANGRGFSLDSIAVCLKWKGSDMTKACFSRWGKGNRMFSKFSIIIFLNLIGGWIAFGSELPKMHEETASETKGAEFILGPGDKLEISVYRHEDLTKSVQVDRLGKVVYPFVGEVQAGGLSVAQLRNTLRAGLEKYLIKPEVFITVSAVVSQSAIILGEVANPGLFTLENPRTCIQMIALAGGFTKTAKPETILLIRGGLKEPELITLNLQKVIKKKDFTQNVALRNGDIIYVPATRIENMSRYFDHLQRIFGTFYQAVFSGLMATSTTK